MFRAIKCIKFCQDTYATAYREADILKNLRHPAIPIIYDIEEDNGYVYIVEEYIEGLSLADLISKRKLNIERVIEFTLKLCDILKYLHSNRTFHLDIKPENVIVSGKQIKLIDYGSAITEGDEPDIRTGTIGYASPEMYGKERIESGSDVYSLGVLMLFMLTGDKSQYAILHVSDKSLKSIIEKCICHSVRERITSVEILERKLKQYNKKMVDNVSLNIHVGGIEKHCGTTHCSFAINHIMKIRKLHSIVCEYNNTGDFFEIIKDSDFKFNKGIFELNGVVIMPNYHGYVNTEFLSEYDRIIKDYGQITEENKEEFLSGDIIYIVSGAMPYEIARLKEFIEAELSPINKRYNILINQANQLQYRNIIKKFGINNPVRVPYAPDISKCKKDWLT